MSQVFKMFRQKYVKRSFTIAKKFQVFLESQVWNIEQNYDVYKVFFLGGS